jgi:hypothetical protein
MAMFFRFVWDTPDLVVAIAVETTAVGVSGDNLNNHGNP